MGDVADAEHPERDGDADRHGRVEAPDENPGYDGIEQQFCDLSHPLPASSCLRTQWTLLFLFRRWHGGGTFPPPSMASGYQQRRPSGRSGLDITMGSCRL